MSADWPEPTPMPPVDVIEVGPGPEDVLAGDDGTIYTGLRDGRVVRFSTVSGGLEILTLTDGSPLGLEFFDDDHIVVCDAEKGLIRVHLVSGHKEFLVPEFHGEPLRFCNNAAVAPDGTIYFSQSTRRYPFGRHLRDIIQGVPTGRLFRRDPDGTVAVVVDHLRFANGVALHPDGEFVLVAETGGVDIVRHWLRGPKAGTTDLFVERLPAVPDNLSVGSDGLLWVAYVSPITPAFEMVEKLPIPLRKLVSYIPEGIGPGPQPLCRVAAFDWGGNVVHDLVGDPTRFTFVTGVRERDGTVYLGTLEGDHIGRFRLADV